MTAKPLICSRCHKELIDDGWSNFVTKDDSGPSPEWGPAVCYVSEDNVLHEHTPIESP
jgi:hypothetical protein